ncbi:uncharacterized protein ARMOST_00136 [Armillaria ostoyae]|uniref:LysM domain-containing protein n=1 Tax=Armillaria ostoyae TaxID=47428 RepID=A0A284QKA2_ARMOS|nr:uncharacterized protein ARMOST_00136 [Armillaria ostoyae]
MDKFYNKKDVRDALQTFIVESRQIQRYHLASKPAWLGKASMMSVDNDQTWRMVETDNENQLEEMVFTLQGIIAKKDLPLVNDIPLRDNYGFLQQNVRLTGLGCQAFKDTADTILEAQLVFERQFPKGMFQEWTPDNTDDNMSVNISNCYLKSCTIHPQEEASLEKGVDPKSILAAACTKRNLIHMEDNKVRFFTSSIDDEGERREALDNPRHLEISVSTSLKGHGLAGMEKHRLDHWVNMPTNIIRPIPARGKENQHYKSPARQFTFSIQNMFARTFTFIAIIAATVIGVNATCDNGLPGYTHIAVPGDTCSSIAAQGGINVAQLQSANPGMNCNALLFVGQRICVPSN